jgi:glycosyltransferase involved in cell wall biosynthesis
MAPFVSVVIPTRNRPALVCRAVNSVLAQSYRDVEVVVVLDGRDDATIAALQTIQDCRLRVTVLEASVGASAARNAGIAEVHSPWIAFLDDDDEWLPAKLEMQISAALQSCYSFPIVTCRVVARRRDATFIWPRRMPQSGEHTSEYLFCRHSPFWGEGEVLTSTVLTKRQLLSVVPFRVECRRYSENDWLLRAMTIQGAGIEFAGNVAPLAVWHIDLDRVRLTSSPEWRESMAWISEVRGLVTERAYAAFILTDVGVTSARLNEWSAFAPLLKEAYQHGRPRLIDIAIFIGAWIMPSRVQHWLARFFANHASAGGAGAAETRSKTGCSESPRTEPRLHRD